MVLLWASMLTAQARLDLLVPGDQQLRFGEPFEVLVQVQKALQAAPFDAAWLRPLVVDEAESGAARGATWRCRVRAFAVGDLTLGGDVDVVVAPGEVVRAQVPPVTLRVASVLPEPPGDYEWPGDVREPARGSWWPFVLVALALVGAGALALRGRQAVPATAPAAPPEVPPHQLVLAKFAALGDDLDDLAFHTELAALVRRYLALRYDLHADVRTSEELWTHHDRDGALLRDCLWRCDLVKFACLEPPRDERERARQAAIAFVRRTASPGEAA